MRVGKPRARFCIILKSCTCPGPTRTRVNCMRVGVRKLTEHNCAQTKNSHYRVAMKISASVKDDEIRES